MKLPIKARILELAIEKDGPFTSKEFSQILEKEYRGEKTTTVKNVDKQLDMYCRVGFLTAENVEVGKDGQIDITYMITETGKKNLKYIPGHGNKIF